MPITAAMDWPDAPLRESPAPIPRAPVAQVPTPTVAGQEPPLPSLGPTQLPATAAGLGLTTYQDRDSGRSFVVVTEAAERLRRVSANGDRLVVERFSKLRTCGADTTLAPDHSTMGLSRRSSVPALKLKPSTPTFLFPFSTIIFIAFWICNSLLGKIELRIGTSTSILRAL